MSQNNTAESVSTSYSTTIAVFLVAIGLTANAAHAQDKIYWTETGSGIFSADFDGTNVQQVLSTLPEGFVIDEVGGKMYWALAPASEIRRADLDGTNIQTVVTGLTTGAQHITIDEVNLKLYWIDESGLKISRSDLDGSNLEDVVTGLTFPIGLEVDGLGGKVYWTESASIDAIMTADLDGTNLQSIYTGTGTPLCLALDVPAGKIYWTESPPSSDVRRANLNGSNVEILQTYSNPQGIALDIKQVNRFQRRGNIYVTDFGTGSIMVTNLNGIGLTTFITTSQPVQMGFIGSGVPTGLPSGGPKAITIAIAILLSLGVYTLRSIRKSSQANTG